MDDRMRREVCEFVSLLATSQQEKFWRNDHANAVLQLRADSLSNSQPLKKFWTRWRANQTGANRNRTTVL